MIKQLCRLAVFFCATALSAEIIRLPASNLREQNISRFTFELASTPNLRAWGLMGRKELAMNHGMLFAYPSSNILSLWSFNCYIPLSVAFMDEEKIIRDIQDLEAYPEKMDPERPVHTLEDLSQYPSYDPILRFFQSKSIRSSSPAKYALEMNLHWFAANDVKKGDVVNWRPNSGNGEIVHTWDLSKLQPAEDKMFVITNAIPSSVAISIPNSPIPIDALFFDSNDFILSQTSLPAGAQQSKREKSVFLVDAPVHRVAILPTGWVEKNSVDMLLSVLNLPDDKELSP